MSFTLALLTDTVQIGSSTIFSVMVQVLLLNSLT